MAKKKRTTARKSTAAGRKKILQRIRKEVDAAHRAAVNKLKKAGKRQSLVYLKADEHIKSGGYIKGTRGYTK